MAATFLPNFIIQFYFEEMRSDTAWMKESLQYVIQVADY